MAKSQFNFRLRGWVSPEIVQKEMAELQNYCNESAACTACAKQSIECKHPTKPSLVDRIKELKRKRTLKPVLLIFLLYAFYELSTIMVIQPYIILVLNAIGTPINAHFVTVLLGITSVSSCSCVLFTIQALGKRRIYLTSNAFVVVCSVALSKCVRWIG